MSSRYSVDVSWYDTDITVLSLLGEHDVAGKDELAKRLQKPILDGELLVVDLSETEFIDCSVLNNLCAADRLARARGLRVALQLQPGSPVARVLEIVGLTEQLLCAESRHETARLARLGYDISSAPTISSARPQAG
jgi:anti-anti-sigma factor